MKAVLPRRDPVLTSRLPYVLRLGILDDPPRQQGSLIGHGGQEGNESTLSTCSFYRYFSSLYLKRMNHNFDTPAYGRRLLPVTIDQIAADQPDRAWASLPRIDSDLSEDYIDVTHQAFAKAINEVPWLIDEDFGRSQDVKTIAYLGTPDIRYYMLQMAAAKTGYKVCNLLFLLR